MKTKLFASLSVACLGMLLSLGCEPRPVVEQPPSVEQPAVEVDVNPAPPTTDSTTIDDSTGVDVQVGGGQGVQVDVNEAAPQQ